MSSARLRLSGSLSAPPARAPALVLGLSVIFASGIAPSGLVLLSRVRAPSGSSPSMRSAGGGALAFSSSSFSSFPSSLASLLPPEALDTLVTFSALRSLPPAT